MRSGSDWRDGIPFEKPTSLAEVAPGEPTRCFVCGPASEAVERTGLFAYKHRHPGNHDGFVRFYCAEHVPATVAPVVPAPVVAGKPARKARVAGSPARQAPARTPRPTPSADRIRPVCPECFMEVPPTGVCGNCGTTL
ncbi:glucose-6-phosphate dehydrogenase [Microbacterium sp. GXF7504]